MTKEIVKASSLIPFLNQKNKKDLKFNPESDILRKEVFLTKAESLNENEGTVWCTITTKTVDRMGDVVLSEGIDTSEFNKIPSVYVNHDYSLMPIASCEEIVYKNDSIMAKVKFVKEDTLSMKVFNLIKAGAMKGISIGFDAKEVILRGSRGFDDICKSLNMDVETYNKTSRIIKSWMMYEFSIVSIPANSECMVKSIKAEDKPEEVEEVKEAVEVSDSPKENAPDKPTEEVKEVTEEPKEEVEEVKTVKEVNPNVTEEMKDHVKLTKYLKECGLNDEQVEGAFEKIVEGELDKDPDFYKQDKEEEEVKDIEPDKEEEEEVKTDDVLVTHPLVDKDPIPTIEPKKIVIIPQVKRFIQVIKTPDDDQDYIKTCVEARLRGRTRITIV